MPFPKERMRRLRRTPQMRSMLAETHLHVEDFMVPLFIKEGQSLQEEIPSMPGVFQISLDNLPKNIEKLAKVGIQAVLLFGIPKNKDQTGKLAADPKGLIPQAVKSIKKDFPHLLVATDVCLCEWLEHGHCGLVCGEEVLNDETLPALSAMALAHAEAGCDILAPSDMMDGRIAFLRQALDEHRHNNLPLMSYSVKMASAFYGPFRDAAENAPQFGDRKTYQMNHANPREAMQEAFLDVKEGADILMVKPALSNLDLIHQVKQATFKPLAAYQVSGEYSMLWAAHRSGWLDLEQAALETLISIKRAGADIILSYFAPLLAKKLTQSSP